MSSCGNFIATGTMGGSVKLYETKVGVKNMLPHKCIDDKKKKKEQITDLKFINDDPNKMIPRKWLAFSQKKGPMTIYDYS